LIESERAREREKERERERERERGYESEGEKYAGDRPSWNSLLLLSLGSRAKKSTPEP
jgi:hypothetical protein